MARDKANIPCPHLQFVSSAEISRLSDKEGGPVTGYSIDLRVKCADCDEQFIFLGLPGGLSPHQPMVSLDRTELRAPICPESSVAALA